MQSRTIVRQWAFVLVQPRAAVVHIRCQWIPSRSKLLPCRVPASPPVRLFVGRWKDAIGSEFGSRHTQYGMFCSGTMVVTTGMAWRATIRQSRRARPARCGTGGVRRDDARHRRHLCRTGHPAAPRHRAHRARQRHSPSGCSYLAAPRDGVDMSATIKEMRGMNQS